MVMRVPVPTALSILIPPQTQAGRRLKTTAGVEADTVVLDGHGYRTIVVLTDLDDDLARLGMCECVVRGIAEDQKALFLDPLSQQAGLLADM